MKSTWYALFGGAMVALGLLGAPLVQANPRPLVDAAWLREALAAGDVLLLDAQPGKLHEAGHIPGAVHVDLFAYGPDEADAQAMQRRMQSWGVSPGRTVVIYDQGGSYLAPRLFYELLYRGHPPERLHLLDGGMARWRALWRSGDSGEVCAAGSRQLPGAAPRGRTGRSSRGVGRRR